MKENYADGSDSWIAPAELRENAIKMLLWKVPIMKDPPSHFRPQQTKRKGETLGKD
jgi:hypothetical protein